LDAARTYTFIVDQLQNEQKKYFKDKNKIILLEKLLQVSKTHLDKWKEIEELEKYHQQVVNKK
jgi:predicted patatin/cPLA2 family phospholipase